MLDTPPSIVTPKKFDDDDWEEIRRRLSRGETMSEIARAFHVNLLSLNAAAKLRGLGPQDVKLMPLPSPAGMGQKNRRVYQHPQELRLRVEAYFADCLLMEKPLTVNGFAAALDLTRAQVQQYEEIEAFRPIIRAARIRIAASVEERLLSQSSSGGPIFWLKNNDGWVDRQERELSNPPGESFKVHFLGITQDD